MAWHAAFANPGNQHDLPPPRLAHLPTGGAAFDQPAHCPVKGMPRLPAHGLHVSALNIQEQHRDPAYSTVLALSPGSGPALGRVHPEQLENLIDDDRVNSVMPAWRTLRQASTSSQVIVVYDPDAVTLQGLCGHVDIDGDANGVLRRIRLANIHPRAPKPHRHTAPVAARWCRAAAHSGNRHEPPPGTHGGFVSPPRRLPPDLQRPGRTNGESAAHARPEDAPAKPQAGLCSAPMRPKPVRIGASDDWRGRSFPVYVNLPYQVNRLEFQRRVENRTDDLLHLTLTAGTCVRVSSIEQPAQAIILHIIVPANFGCTSAR